LEEEKVLERKNRWKAYIWYVVSWILGILSALLTQYFIKLFGI